MNARQWLVNVARQVRSPAVDVAPELPLAAFQEAGARRLAAIVRRWGGALLADGVGLGKTRVAASVIATIAREERLRDQTGDVWFVVPARLEQGWRAAADACGLAAARMVTHAAMSRGTMPETPPLAVVVDEAHRFRNRDARRTRALRALTCPLVLVTATPIVNSVDDLWGLLELALDDVEVRRALGWDLATARTLALGGNWDASELLREVCVRRTTGGGPDFGRRPSVSLEVVNYVPRDSEAWVWAHLGDQIRRLRIASDGWPRGLFVEHVLRRWESGPDALLETLRNIRGFAGRRRHALARGRDVDRQQFRDIFGGGAGAQGVFDFVLPRARAAVSISELDDDLTVLDGLISRVQQMLGDGPARDDLIAELAGDGEPLLAFTSYRSAARGLFDRLVSTLGPQARVAMLTGDGARATGLGHVSGVEVLHRFAPRAHGVQLRDHERIQVLVATDCISEGVNLQDCARMVHVDLPPTPLAVEQRVGRLVRPGSAKDIVRVILPRPTNWNDTLGLRTRLNEKRAVADHCGFSATGAGPLATLSRLESIAAIDDVASTTVPTAASCCQHPTIWLCLARVGDRPWLFTVGLDVELTAMLAELVWDETEITGCDIPVVVTEAIADRQQFLTAAHAAPEAIALDDPRAAAWRLIVAAAERLALSADDLQVIRSTLLTGQRRPVLAALARAVATGDPTRVLRLARTLPPPTAAPRVTLVTALGLTTAK